jgi:hypothetical protein
VRPSPGVRSTSRWCPLRPDPGPFTPPWRTSLSWRRRRGSAQAVRRPPCTRRWDKDTNP